MRLTSAIEMVNKLEPAHLQSFWYFASKVNLAIIGTFGSLLWVTSDSPAEAEFYRSQLAEYRWTLRVSSKAAEFMKFTVGMLDASAVFLKDKDSKTSTTVLVREQAGQEDQKGGQNPRKETRQDMDLEQAVQDYGQADCGSNEVSPSVGDSTENAYPYEMDFAGNRFTPGSDTRPALGGFADTVHFNTGHVPDWSLDQLYNFENLHGIEDVLGNRRMVEEYDEAGNDFAGF
jgi:hypothetical protein